MPQDFYTVITAEPLDNFRLALRFDNGEERIFDMSPYLEKGIFQELRNPALFKQAYVAHGTVNWQGGRLDMSPATLYLRSVTQALS